MTFEPTMPGRREIQHEESGVLPRARSTAHPRVVRLMVT